MSYSPSTNPPHAITEGGLQADLAKLWIYTSTDTDLSGSYFSDGQTRGMKVNDLIFGIDQTTPAVKLYRVSAVAAINPSNPTAARGATTTTGVLVGN